MKVLPISEMSNSELDALAERNDRKRLFTLYADLEATSSKAWLVQHMLGAGDLSAFYGPPGCGKGVIIEDLCLHVAAGREWHGRAVTRGAVLYVALERKKVVDRRAIAFRTKTGLQDLPFAVMGGVYDFRHPATADQIASAGRQLEEATSERLGLIVVDTVSRALAGGDENSPKDMGALITTTALIQERTGAHVLLVHHIPHDSDRLRGHGALLGAVDTSVSVANHGTIRSAKVVKANDSEEGEGVSFTIESVEVADDGTTAPVAVPVEASGVAAHARSGKWAKGLRLVHEAILAALEQGKDHRVAGDGPTVKVVPVQAARAIHNQRYVSNGEGDRYEAERKAWTRNFRTARNSNLIGGEMHDGQELIWLV